MMAGKGNTLKWGEIVVQSDAAPLDEMKRLLDSIIRDHGNPVHDKAPEEKITDLFADFDKEKQGEKKDKNPWER